jgi:hypothetical protein
VFSAVTDPSGRLVQNVFNVRPTNSGAAPVIQEQSTRGENPVLTTRGFSFTEPGSRIELRYVQTGLRYRCVPSDNCVVATDSLGDGTSRIEITVPRLQDEGRDVEIRLVNDTATSAAVSIRLADSIFDSKFGESASGALLALGSDFESGVTADRHDSSTACGESYSVWRSLGDPQEVVTQPSPRPTSVSIKSRPTMGSVVGSKALIYSWTGALVDSLRFNVPMRMQRYDGRCANRVLSN